MGRISNPRKRILRKNLMAIQDGRCFWCHKHMEKNVTLDHLDEKDSPNRGQFCGVRRVVLACAKCNHSRSRYSLEHRLMMADQAFWMLQRLEAA